MRVAARLVSLCEITVYVVDFAVGAADGEFGVVASSPVASARAPAPSRRS